MTTPAPKPTDWRLGVWRSFLRAHAVVIRDLGRELEDEAAMPLAWCDVLVTLAQAPERRLRRWLAHFGDDELATLGQLMARLYNDGDNGSD